MLLEGNTLWVKEARKKARENDGKVVSRAWKKEWGACDGYPNSNVFYIDTLNKFRRLKPIPP
ncbi:hypothetical protein CR194_17135 [Salipaludibacillus keqinensis]|uniref:Uncharacterized protein n=1 Tax=Salipaludibacillus keqinensis TaxID=2045207 RepID=A0A323TAB5_9BACI|nr:hypothetical protein CR194_17135 [Salipaludibacillus keqinensis]